MRINLISHKQNGITTNEMTWRQKCGMTMISNIHWRTQNISGESEDEGDGEDELEVFRDTI